MKQNSLFIVMTFCVLFLILVLLACTRTTKGVSSETTAATVIGPGEIQLSPQAASTLRVEPVKLLPDRPELQLSGKIVYDDDRYSKVLSPVIGRIMEVRVKLGDWVAQGDTLLVIESPEIGTAYADYVKADSDLATVRHSLDLAKNLYEGKALSRKDLEQAENDAQKTQAEFLRARERLLNLHVPKEELDKPLDQQSIQSTLFLRSPISGKVIERNAILGQTVGNDSAQTLFTVADLSSVIAIADLAENDIVRVLAGQKVDIVADSYPGLKFSGRVAYISDLIDPSTRTLKLRCRVENISGRLKPEMFVRVILFDKRNSTVLPQVPRSSLLHEGEHDFLFVQTGPNQFSRRNVLSQGSADRMAVILKGVKAGEEVVTEGGILLENFLANPS